MCFNIKSYTILERYLLFIMISLQRNYGCMCQFYLFCSDVIFFTAYYAHFYKIGNLRIMRFKYFCWIVFCSIILRHSSYIYYCWDPVSYNGSSPNNIISSKVPKFWTTFLHILASLNLSLNYIYLVLFSYYFFQFQLILLLSA